MLALAATALAVVWLTGCVVAPDDSILAVKDTVLGVDIGSSNPQTYHMRIGLVRRFYQRIPVGTNAIFAPDYATAVDGGVGLTHQNAKEMFRTGQFGFDESPANSQQTTNLVKISSSP